MLSFLSPVLLAVFLVGAAFAQDLSTVQTKLHETREAAFDKRQQWVEALTKIPSKEARELALTWYRNDQEHEFRVRFLEHAMLLPRLDRARTKEFDTLMLRVLERGEDLPLRVIGARYFVEVHGKSGIDLCLALTQEHKTPPVHEAVLVAFGYQPKRSRATDIFVKNFEASPPTVREHVLRRLRGRSGSHIDKVRLQALQDPYPPLKSEAILQLAGDGSKQALGLARQLADGSPKPELAPVLFEVLTRSLRPGDLVRLGKLSGHASLRMRRLVRAAVEDLGKREDVRMWSLGPGRLSKNAHVRALALHFLEVIDGKPADNAIYDLVSDPDQTTARRAVFALARRKSKRLVGLLEKRLLKGRVEDRMDALEALDLIIGETEPFQNRLVALSQDRPVELRLLAIQLGAKRGLRGLMPQLPRMLAHNDWRVRAAGIQLARLVREKSSVPLLLAMLRKERGRLVDDIKKALSSLTRLYFATPGGWNTWWLKERTAFVLPPAEGEKPKPAARSQREGGTTVATFYGIPVVSERVIYCMDISGSMTKLVGTGLTRLKVAKESLKRVFKRAPKSSHANVLFFHGQVKPFAHKMVSLRSPKKVADLIAFVDKQRALGETNIYGALMRAMEEKLADTIYLLSDGEPSAGEIQDPEDLAEEILRHNRSRRIVINCIAIGQKSPLLQQLARETGGTYVVH